MCTKLYYVGPVWAALLTGCGCMGEGEDGIGPVYGLKEYIVELTTEAGETIQERATALSDALKGLWRTFFPQTVDGVEVDPHDPLRGELQGNYVLKIVSLDNGSETQLTLNLSRPRMRRATESSPWELDLSQYPELQDSVAAE